MGGMTLTVTVIVLLLLLSLLLLLYPHCYCYSTFIVTLYLMLAQMGPQCNGYVQVCTHTCTLPFVANVSVLLQMLPLGSSCALYKSRSSPLHSVRVTRGDSSQFVTLLPIRNSLHLLHLLHLLQFVTRCNSLNVSHLVDSSFR